MAKHVIEVRRLKERRCQIDTHALRQNMKRSVLKSFVILGAILPFAMSLVFSRADSHAQPIEGTPDRPGLAFDQYLVNFPEIEPTHMVSARFAFKNSSDTTVTIKDLKPSCGCLRPRLKNEKHVFKPGERGEFYMRVETDKEPTGPKEYYCDVIYEDTKPRETRVTFKVTLPEKKVTVTPKSLIFFQPNEQRTTHKLYIDNYTDGPLHVVGVESSLKLADAIIGEPEVSDDGRRRQVVLVSVAAVPKGRHPGNITIFTTHPVHRKIVVPLRVDGPVR
ncbi:MAG: hypothetical protein CMJ78_20785 [Planctomycetaceae bacterium]|nr:hypothetical protein [Planctomycetaceae bacterium]